MNLKKIGSTVISGSFMKNVGFSALGIIGGELASGALRKANVSNVISEAVGGASVAAAGIAFNKPEIAVATVATKGIKAISGVI